VTQPTSAVHQYTSVSPRSKTCRARRGHVGEIAAGGVTMPLGLPVVRGGVEDEQHVPASIASAGHPADSRSSSSCHQWSRPSVICAPTRRRSCGRPRNA